MTKRELLAQNIALFEKMQHVSALADHYKGEAGQLEKKIDELNDELGFLRARLKELEEADSDASKRNKQQDIQPGIEESGVHETELSWDSFDPSSLPLNAEKTYGAQVIGKIVVEATRASNALAGEENAKELMSLILGKTEMIKYEILSITESFLPLDDKKRMIDDQYALAVEYFDIVKGQM